MARNSLALAFLLAKTACGELVLFQSSSCRAWGCEEASSQQDCTAWAGLLGRNASVVSSAVNPAPLGCYFYSSADRVYFNSGAKEEQPCSAEQRCVCQCPTGIDVAFYHDVGASTRAKNNVYEVLQYATTDLEPIRVHNFSATDFHTRLERAVHDVALFPGGSGSKEESGLSASGQAAVKEFLAKGGGYVGICAGAYLAITSSYKISPFKNIVKPKPNPPGRGDGNVTLRVAENSTAALAAYGVENTNLDSPSSLVFYGGGPVMVLDESAVAGNISDPRILVEYTSSVPIELNLTGAISGIGDAAVVASTWAGAGTVVASGPHPETDQLDFPDRHGPPSATGSVYAALLQSYVRYAAVPQP